MNNFNNNTIEDIIKNVNVEDKKHRNFGKKLKNQDFSEEMMEVKNLYKKITNNTEYLKCLLVLSLKKVTWQRELREKFDCSGSIISYFIEYMKQNGFILTKQLIDIDDILYETILRTNPKDFYSQTTKVNLLTLTLEGESFAKRVLEDCIKLQRNDILFTINEINNKTKAFRKVYDEIIELENKLSYSKNGVHIIDGYRYVKYPDGTIVMRKTLLKKRLDRERVLSFQKLTPKNAIILNETKALTSLNKNDLVLLDEIIEEEEKIEYNGIYANLNSYELEEFMEGVNKNEEKEIEKEYQDEIKSKLAYYNNEKRNSYQEGLDFLNSL